MKILNFRAFLYTAVNILAASFIAVALSLSIALGVILFSILILINIVLAITFRRKLKYAFSFSFTAVLLMLMITIALLTVNVKYADIDYSKSHKVQGRVYSVNVGTDDCVIVVDKLSIDNKDYCGKMKIYAEIESADKLMFLQKGYELNFTDTIDKIELYDGFINPSAANDGIRYKAYTQSALIEYTPKKAGLLTALHNKLKSSLTDFMGDKYGNIAYGILSGDKNSLDSSVLSYYSASGLGHVLAVSGLHLGFLVSAVMFIMKKVSAKIKVPIAVVIIALYSIFAGLSTSVLRAAIMSCVGLVTLINGQRSDLLNNLSLAFAVITASAPFILFDIGFAMSFSAVFGIACFGNLFNRLLKKTRIPHFIASAISVSVAAQLGITPCIMFYFHSLPLYSILANIILMPLIMLVFITLLLTSVITLIIGSGVTLIVPETLLILLDGTSHFTANLPFSQINVFVNAFIFIVPLLYFVMSGYFMIPKFKYLVNIGAAVCCAVICCLSVTYLNIDNAVIPINGYNDVSSIVFTENKVLLVGDCKNFNSIYRTLNERYIRKIDEVYLTSITEQTAQTLIVLKNEQKLGDIYCPYIENENGLSVLAENKIAVNIFDYTEALPSIKQEYFEGRFVGYNIPIAERKNILFLSYNTDYAKVDASIMNQTAIIRCKTFTGFFDDRIFLTNYSLDIIDESEKYVYSIKESGNYIFNYKEGRVYR